MYFSLFLKSAATGRTTAQIPGLTGIVFACHGVGGGGVIVAEGASMSWTPDPET